MNAAAQLVRLTAWDNPAWVLAVMHYPNSELPDYVRAGNESLLTPLPSLKEAWTESGIEAARAGKTAGIVLGVLYGLSTAPWRIPEPSLAKAVHVAENLALIDKQSDQSRDRPAGHTKIEQCFDRMRSVGHLWAAVWLHSQYASDAEHEKLMRTDAGIRGVLRIARAVQEWAVDWQPSRTNARLQPPPLLGEHPWLVPSNVIPSPPPWNVAPWDHSPDWLIGVVDNYQRRDR